MLVLNTDVFDEIITGTTTTWYSSAEHNGAVGQADWIAALALTTNVSGAPAGLAVWVDGSPDNQNWVLSTAAAGDLPIASISDGSMGQALGYPYHPFVRFRIALTGTNPNAQCRLKLSVTGRNGD